MLAASKDITWKWAAVTQDGLALLSASPALCENEAVLLAAVTQDGGALEYASLTLRANRRWARRR